MTRVQIKQALNPAQITAVKEIFLDYLAVLNTGFGNETGCADGLTDMQSFPHNYEALFLAKLGGEPVAACGVKRVNEKDCELVRLYCRPTG